jgi:hypothetical protein
MGMKVDKKPGCPKNERTGWRAMGELACTFSERLYLGKRIPGPRFAKSSKTRGTLLLAGKERSYINTYYPAVPGETT